MVGDRRPVGLPNGSPLKLSVGTPADLLALLAADPTAATRQLARQLKGEVEDLSRTDPQTATELAKCVAVVAERVGDDQTRALAFRALGLAALASGSRTEALSHYQAAEALYRRAGDEVERARVLRSLMDPLMHLGRYDEALAAGHEAQTVFLRSGLTVLAAQVEANVGSVFHRLDRNAESLAAYDRALTTFRAAGEDEAVAMVEYNRANIFANLDDLIEAERGYRSALSFYRARGLRMREAQCLYALAYLAYLRSRHGEALRLFERVRELDVRIGNLDDAARCELSRAEVLLALNAWEEAGEVSRSVRPQLEELGMRSEAARAVLLEGLSAVHLRRFDDAARRLADARRLFAQEGNEIQAALADLYRAELGTVQDDPRAALGLARAAARTFGAAGLRTKEAYARIVAARSLVAMGRPTGARRECSRALRRLKAAPSGWIIFQAHHLLGHLAGSPAAARRHFEEAMAAVERLRSQVLPDELLASFQRDKLSLYDDLERLLLSPTAETDLAAAFTVVELAKARVLGDALARSPSAPRASRGRASRGLLALKRGLEELNASYGRLNAVELESSRRPTEERLRREIEERETRLARLFRRMQLESGPASTATESHGVDDLPARVGALLAPDEALVEFFTLGQELHAFVLRGAELRWSGALCRLEEVRDVVARLRFLTGKSALGAGVLRAQREALGTAMVGYLERLSRSVWEPLTAFLDGAAKLVVVPAGPLFYVPFHALREDGAFLVERREVSQAVSARAFVAAHRRGRRARGVPLVLGVSPPELPSVAAELDALRRALPQARVLAGTDARRAALHRFGEGASIVHIASHAAFRSDNPLLSAIELEDGRLTFYDLFDLRLDADLVVLSGCRTGHQRVLEGDELMGLARGFLYAGAGSLLASLWSVEDDATAAFMERFYRCLGGGDDGPRAALCACMRGSIAEGRQPHEWAAFYLTGRARGFAGRLATGDGSGTRAPRRRRNPMRANTAAAVAHPSDAAELS